MSLKRQRSSLTSDMELVSEPLLDSTEYRYEDDEHSDSVLKGLNATRNSGEFCDVVLCVEAAQFPCHKAVLTSFSPYFKAMFTSPMVERTQSHVVVNGIDAGALRDILDYAYTSSVTVTPDNVQSLLAAANLLQVSRVKNACCVFLQQRMDETNCLGIHTFAETYACTELEAKAKEYICTSFGEVMRHEEFLEISAAKLIQFFSLDDVKVEREELLFEGALAWLNHNPAARAGDFGDVLQHIRLPLMSPYYLVDTVGKAPAVLQNQRCCQLLEEAKILLLLPDRRRERCSPWTTARNGSSKVEAFIMVGGFDGRMRVPSVDCYVPSSDLWLNLASLPRPLSHHGVAAVGHNSLLVAGGQNMDGSFSRAVWLFDPMFNSWCEAAPMNAPKRSVSLAALDGFVYALGGWDGQTDLTSVERYDAARNQWKVLQPMKARLRAPMVAASLGGQVVIGGISLADNGKRAGCFQCYDPKTDAWLELTPMLMTMQYSASCVVSGKLYVIGGWDPNQRKSSPAVQCFDPSTNTWSPCKPMKHGRLSPAVGVLGAKIYVFGGQDSPTQHMSSAEVYHVDTDSWFDIKEMRAKRSWSGCASLSIPSGMLNLRRPKPPARPPELQLRPPEV